VLTLEVGESPHCPYVLRPHKYTSPLDAITAVWYPPQDIWMGFICIWTRSDTNRGAVENGKA